MALDWMDCPEAQGAVTAFTADSTGMRWPEELGPVRAGPGEVTQGHAERLFLPDPAEREDRRHAEALGYDAGEAALRSLVHGAARSAGADYRTAARTADELVKRAPAVPGISEQAMGQLLDTVEKAVAATLAGTQPRPHRRTKPLPDAEPVAETAEPETTEATS